MSVARTLHAVVEVCYTFKRYQEGQRPTQDTADDCSNLPPCGMTNQSRLTIVQAGHMNRGGGESGQASLSPDKDGATRVKAVTQAQAG